MFSFSLLIKSFKIKLDRFIRLDNKPVTLSDLILGTVIIQMVHKPFDQSPEFFQTIAVFINVARGAGRVLIINIEVFGMPVSDYFSNILLAIVVIFIMI